VTFQQTQAPAAGYVEQMRYYSKKHSLYGMKAELSVLPNGLAIHVSAARPGATHDLVMCEENLEFHRMQLAKLPDEQHVPDDGPLYNEHSNSWALLANKGYQGLARDLRAITPYKQPPTGSSNMLTIEQMDINRAISSDRIIVENFFGRMKSLWTVTSSVYKWKRENYDVFLQCAVALTNVHVHFLPLRDDDAGEYYQYENRLMEIGTHRKRARAVAQTNDRQKRKKRLATLLRDSETFYEENVDHGLDNSYIFD